MYFSKTSEVRHIVTANGIYHLNIKTDYQDNRVYQPDNVYINITIVKIHPDYKYKIETLELVYSYESNFYIILNDLRGFGKLIYTDILNILENSRGGNWRVK